MHCGGNLVLGSSTALCFRVPGLRKGPCVLKEAGLPNPPAAATQKQTDPQTHAGPPALYFPVCGRGVGPGQAGASPSCHTAPLAEGS